MSIYKRGGRWAAMIDLDRETDGARKRRYLGSFSTKKEAESHVRRALDERERGIDLEPSKVTVSDLLERYIRDCEARNVEPSTTERYRGIVKYNIGPRIGSMPLAKLKPAHLSDLYGTLLSSGRSDDRKGGLAPKTVGHVHGLLKAAIKWAMRMQLVQRNVCDAVDAPRAHKHEARAFSADDVAALLNAAAGTRIAAFITLAFATGARRGELLALKWDAVDFDRATLTIRSSLAQTSAGVRVKAPKTNRTRTVSLSSSAIEALRRQRATQAQDKLRARAIYVDDGFVFADPLGQPLAPSSLTNGFARIAKQAKVSSKRLHDARHTAATWMIADGADIRTVSAVLGHSATSTTLNIYTHAIEGAQPAAVAKIDQRLRAASGERA